MAEKEKDLEKLAKDKFKTMFGFDAPEDANVVITTEKRNEKLWKKIKQKN